MRVKIDVKLAIREMLLKGVPGMYGESGLADARHSVDGVDRNDRAGLRALRDRVHECTQFSISTGESGRVPRQDVAGAGGRLGWLMVDEELVAGRLVDRLAFARVQLPLALTRDASLPVIGR